jgi:hypothetical protein
MCVPHAVAFACQNIHRICIFPCKYHTALLGFLSAELALGIIFLAISSIFTCCESGWLIPSPTKNSTADITHPHTTHNHTTKNVTPGSLVAAWQQREALRRQAAWGWRQHCGSAVAATAAWLWREAWQRRRQHGSAVAAGAAWWRRAAWQRRRQLGGSAAAAVAVAAQQRQRQLGGNGSIRQRRLQLGGGSSAMAAARRQCSSSSAATAVQRRQWQQRRRQRQLGGSGSVVAVAVTARWQ